MRLLGTYRHSCEMCSETWTATNPDADVWCESVRRHYEAHAEPLPVVARDVADDYARVMSTLAAAVESITSIYRRVLLTEAIESRKLVRDDLTPLTDQEADALRFAVIGE